MYALYGKLFTNTLILLENYHRLKNGKSYMRILKNTVESDEILMGVSSWCFAYRCRCLLLIIRQIVYALGEKPKNIRKVTEGQPFKFSFFCIGGGHIGLGCIGGGGIYPSPM
jgi:hypothetical protein